MRRREFIAGLAGAAAWPMVVRAQQAKLPVIGYIDGGARDSSIQQLFLNAFREGLNESGYVDGRNVAIEYRSAGGQYDRLSDLAADLVRRQVAVIFATGNAAAVAAKATNTTIPLVFSIGGDPVALGLVASLGRPNGTTTGVSFLSTALIAISVQMLREAAPNRPLIVALVNPNNPNAVADTEEAERAARSFGMPIRVIHASSLREIDAAFTALEGLGSALLFIEGDPFFASKVEQLVDYTARTSVPAIFNNYEFARIGGLMSYYTPITDAQRLGGTYAGRILKGEKPADLPVQQSVKVELVLNMKTAKAFGITFPLTLLGRADAVIE
jgi:putative tryptophan/tyrosine transport system substrate-binding protein